MKKRLLLVAAVAMANLAAFAQVDNTLQFVDAAGNVVENGATITGVVEHKSDPLNGDYDQISTGLSVRTRQARKSA